MAAPNTTPALERRPAPRLKLYEATDELDTVREFLVESEGELTPEIEELLALAGENFDAKAERVALMVRELAAESAAVKVEADRLVALAKSAERSAESLKAYLARQMERADRPSIAHGLVKLSLTNNSAPSVAAPAFAEHELRELAVLYPGFVRVVPETVALDRAAIATAWKGNAAVDLPDGVVVTRGKHVRIR